MSLGQPDPFLEYIQTILVMEGGGTLTDTPGDNGGVTIWGVTEATARAAGYSGAMAEMSQAEAVAIYRAEFWVAPGFDLVDPILPGLAEYLLEVGINMGPHLPVQFLQVVLNALNNQQTPYRSVAIDGQCGPMTRAALTSYLAARAEDDGVLVLMGALRSLVATHYMAIAQADPSQQAFLYGWLRTRALGL